MGVGPGEVAHDFGHGRTHYYGGSAEEGKIGKEYKEQSSLFGHGLLVSQIQSVSRAFNYKGRHFLHKGSGGDCRFAALGLYWTAKI